MITTCCLVRVLCLPVKIMELLKNSFSLLRSKTLRENILFIALVFVCSLSWSLNPRGKEMWFTHHKYMRLFRNFVFCNSVTSSFSSRKDSVASSAKKMFEVSFLWLHIDNNRLETVFERQSISTNFLTVQWNCYMQMITKTLINTLKFHREIRE